jgi:predicted esterase
VWPQPKARAAGGDGRGNGVVVFLHGLSPKPFREEADAIAALTKLASERRMTVVLPRARKLCANGKKRCWELREIEAELAYLDALVDHLEETRGRAFRERHIIGYSHGGFLLGGAVERGLVAQYARVGIVAGGPVGDAVADKPSGGPPLFLEVGADDKTQWASMHELFQRLTSCPSELYFREVAGGHRINGDRISSFLRWFWTTGTEPRRPASTGSSDPTSPEPDSAPRPVPHPDR